MRSNCVCKTLGILLALLMVLTVLPIFSPPAYAAESTVASFSDLQNAVTGAATDGTQTVIKVRTNITVPSGISIPAGAKVLITSENPESPAVITAGFAGYMLTATSAELMLTDIIIDGGGAGFGASNAAAVYSNLGTVTIGSGAVIQNNFNSGNGGGVFVERGKIVLDGGIIRNNAANNGGGLAILRDGGEIIIRSGVISGNTATTQGGGVFVSADCKLTMSGGEIVNNTASTGNGGGVAVISTNSSFTITDGLIADNKAENAGDGGGGVYLTGGGAMTKYNMIGGVITGNSSTRGGGVFFGSGTHSVGGGIIEKNTAKTDGSWATALGTVNITGNVAIPDSEEFYVQHGNCIVSSDGVLVLRGTVAGRITNNGAVIVINDKGFVTGVVSPNPAQYEDETAAPTIPHPIIAISNKISTPLCFFRLCI